MKGGGQKGNQNEGTKTHCQKLFSCFPMIVFFEIYE